MDTSSQDTKGALAGKVAEGAVNLLYFGKQLSGVVDEKGRPSAKDFG